MLLGLSQLNVLLGHGLMNDRILFFILSEHLILQSNLFLSIIVEGKKVFLKKSGYNNFSNRNSRVTKPWSHK